MKIVREKKKMLVNQYFIFFLQCFLPFPEQISVFQSHYFFDCKCFRFVPIETFELKKKTKKLEIFLCYECKDYRIPKCRG